jgi:RNA polymerase sigma factor (sigma-70 family)
MGTGVRDKEDRAQFARVVAPHLSEAFAVASWLTGNRADAEDVVQVIGGFSGVNARAWVLTIVRNTWLTRTSPVKAAKQPDQQDDRDRNSAYSWLAKNRTPDFVAFQTVLDEEQHLAAQYGGEGFGTSTSSPEAALIAKVAMGHLEAAIAALPVEFREVLILRDVQGLEYREIAQITSLSVGTVMSRLARARRRLIDAIRTDDV